MKGLESRQVSFPLAWQEREAIEGFEMKAALSKIGRGRTINPFEKKEIGFRESRRETIK